MNELPAGHGLDYEGRLAPPRRNGELLFDELWQSRVFGLTMLLYESGAFVWDEFRARLIESIARAEQSSGASPPEVPYWTCWLDAFEALLADKQLCATNAVARRMRELAARPAGHDH